MVQLSQLYMTTGKIIALNIQSFVGRVMSLLFNTLYKFFITFLPGSNHLLISWLQFTILSDFTAQEEEICHYFNIYPFYLSWSNGARCHDLIFFFLVFSLKPVLSLSSFTLIKRLFSYSSISAIKSGNEFLLSSIFSCLLTCWFTVCFFQGDVNFIIICLVNNCLPVLRKCLSHINTMSLINIWVKWMNK